MRLKLNNILKIANADIELGGLTVITGVNDSGKSTIGKVLFSTLKAVNNASQINETDVIFKIKFQLSFIKRMLIRQEINLQELNDIRNLTIRLIERTFNEIDTLTKSILENEQIKNLSSRSLSILEKRLSAIHTIIEKFYNPNLSIKEEFIKISNSEFTTYLLNSFGKECASIEFYDDTNNKHGSTIKIDFANNSLCDIKVNGMFSIEDITYIESPVYLPILNALRLSNSFQSSQFQSTFPYLQKENIPYHIADMAEKILTRDEFVLGLFDTLNTPHIQLLLNEINSLVGGTFIVNIKDNQLYFCKKSGEKIPAINVATGVKSFGVLLRLLETNNISTSKILVIDEPEIHLHPEWQIKFCKLIIELIAKGIPIVISTHSPDFLQGLRYYAAAKGIEQEVVYYLSEEGDDGLSNLRNVTDNLNDVFSLLAAPLQSVMNVDAVRNTMK